MEHNFCNCVLDPCDYYHNFQVEIRSTDLKVKFNNVLTKIDNKTKLVVIENPNGFVGNIFKFNVTKT